MVVVGVAEEEEEEKKKNRHKNDKMTAVKDEIGNDPDFEIQC